MKLKVYVTVYKFISQPLDNNDKLEFCFLIITYKIPKK